MTESIRPLPRKKGFINVKLSTFTAYPQKQHGFFLEIQRKSVDNSIGIRHVAKNKPFTGFLPVDNENED